MPTLINQEMVLDNEDDDGCCIELWTKKNSS